MDEVVEKSKELAKYEVGWWRAHNKKDFDRVVENMAMEYVVLLGIPYEAAEEAVKYRMEATKTHDEAEKLEELGNLGEAETYWTKTEGLLQKHFELLLKTK